ncbi:uncharacterized protein LOC109602190 [Aethina tumida]|uniref:uncharacterized protein LOC109602190 n=1 Tax=Aethina tumida TaxID=116153 RepID=UPI002147F23C|nr:uncharacterized protein LOC109602190 [Aethina tumida]
MKTILPIVTLVLLYSQWCTANKTASTDIVLAQPKKLTLYNLAVKRMMSIWDNLTGKGSTESFIGRCFGAARKLKMMMPLIIFKLGVIVTILMFLTIFSMKSLGLLLFLVMLNVGGIASKLTLLLKHGVGGGHTPPQNVHFHIHPGKDGFHTAPSGPWDRTDDMDSSEKYNLYNKLLKNTNYNLLYNSR